MSRVKLLEKEDVDPMVKQIYEKIEDSGSEVINLLKALAHSPKIFRDWQRLGITLLLKGDLSPRLRELAILRVGDLAKANYEWTKHVPIALQAGAKQEQIDDLSGWKDSTEFNEQERASGQAQGHGAEIPTRRQGKMHACGEGSSRSCNLRRVRGEPCWRHESKGNRCAGASDRLHAPSCPQNEEIDHG